ncbi:MAG: L-seryl-tRNA(Sec) selenium transferase [Clostridia bacterium]|nr:L-seryl-tRNA(Sec) selenium transferase [Clostridia bacterium]
MKNYNEKLRDIPAVDKILNCERCKLLTQIYGHNLVVEAINIALKLLRKKILINQDMKIPSSEMLCQKVEGYLREEMSPCYKRVINGTGIILHTNLGRSILSDKAREAVDIASSCYTNLEYDLEEGGRGERYDHVEGVITKLTGAESALVVNNNAAAVLLVLNTMARGKEVLVSRGELVEIGGSFRIPEVIKLGGVKLVEVGTTNRTHLKDYQDAINENTGLILKVHTSNYKIMGFTKSVERGDLSSLAKKAGIPFVEDLGSGTLLDLKNNGLNDENFVQDVIKTGVDVVTFSGDKLLGGPQAGIILGRKEYIDSMKNNQLTRALRIDKLTLAALEATLREYLCTEKVVNNIPIYRMLATSLEELQGKGEKIKKCLLGIRNKVEVEVEVVDTRAQMGGGSLPGQSIPSLGIIIKLKNCTPIELERKLRKQTIPILGYIEKNNYVLDLRTLLPGDEEIIIKSIYDIMLEEKNIAEGK